MSDTRKPRDRDRRQVERRAPKRGSTVRYEDEDDRHPPKRIRRGKGRA